MSRFPRRELGLAFVCGGLLMMEICLTKIFSIVLWYHFGFLAVSTALLGFASSGVYLALKPKQLTGESADKPIAGAAAIAAITAIASLWLATQTTFDVYTIVQDRTIGTLLAFVLWVTLPFFFLGLVISRALTAFPERVNVLYGFDLIGSAIGCGLAVAVLSWGLSGQAAILIASALVAFGGILFARGIRLTSWVALAAPLACVTLLDVEEVFPLKSPPSKPYYRIESIESAMSGSTWKRGEVTMKSGEVLEVETTEPPAITPDGLGVKVATDDGQRTIPLADIAEKPGGGGLAFEQVPWSPYRRWSSLSRVDAFHWPAAYQSWGLWGLSDRHEADGVEIPRQKGITIDAWAMTSIMRYSGDPIFPPGTPEVDSERDKVKILEYLPAGTVHRIKPAPEKIVCIGAGGGLDLLTAKYFGAKNITGVEINPGVYQANREAFPEFAGSLYDPEKHPDINVQVAEGRHFLERSDETFDVVQLSGVDTFSTTQAGAFSLSENNLYTVEAFETFLDKLNPDGVLTLTRWFYPHVATEINDAGEEVSVALRPRASLRLLGLARTVLEKRGVADAKRSVFFLNSGIFTVILIKPEGFSDADLATLDEHCEYFGYEQLWNPVRENPTILAASGESFANPLQEYMDAEDGAAFLAAQHFDVSPPTDDRPFFFEVSRFSHVFDKEHLVNPLGGFTAHGILIVLFAEVLLLGFLFVLWPMRRLASRHKSPGARRLRLGALLYFTAIGFGFIVVEIVLSQKFVLFLGHPIYALVVILFSMLLFSGIGALASRRFPLPSIATLLAGGLALAPALLFQEVFDRCLHFDLWIRIAISVALLAPVGFIMGIPFPAGVRLLGQVRPAMIPWAWGINGYTSVLGSVLAVILGIELGFMTTLIVAACVYALGVVGYGMMKVRMPVQNDEVEDEPLFETTDKPLIEPAAQTGS